MESRLHLYNSTLAKRDALDADFIADSSRAIVDRVTKMEEFRVSRRVGLYFPFGNEVKTESLFELADINRKEIYFPAKEKNGVVSYFRIMDLAEVLPLADGIIEAPERASKQRDIQNLHALIVPGVVFDMAGRRIGFKMGFFDKCLERFRGVRIALAYDFQVVEKIPMLGDSRRLDWIVTEKRIIRCGG